MTQQHHPRAPRKRQRASEGSTPARTTAKPVRSNSRTPRAPRAGKLSREQKAFLKAFSDEGVISHACKAAGIPRTRFVQWRKEDPTFREAFELAREDVADTFRQEIRRRAIDGVEEVRYRNGGIVEKVKRYSDQLLAFHAQYVIPEYREAREAWRAQKRDAMREAVRNIQIVSVPIQGPRDDPQDHVESPLPYTTLQEEREQEALEEIARRNRERESTGRKRRR